jgi:toxin ParE1/3/4
MHYRVVFSPEADAHLVTIYRYIAQGASSAVAKRFTDAIVDHCEGFHTFPRRGAKRDELRPGLRVVGFRRKVAIAFTVGEGTATILGVFYGGQDYASALLEDERSPDTAPGSR